MQREKIIPINIEDEMRDSYIDYSMSVIVSRALPDVRDGLKPVHRRVLYGMSELGLQAGRAYKKSARVVGEVLGKYHPHGDSAVYDTIVRMVQDFSLRYPLVDGQGNFGSIDGDAPAAMRYTEVRMTRIAGELLRDIDKNTVDFAPNFDDSLEEPTVLPCAIPNLLINGSSGIAVGMATNIPPHNLSEVVDGLIALIDDKDITIDELMKYIKAPDFPTGGIIYGYEGVREAYATGRGKITIRARVKIEEARSGRESIVVTELPYQVNKAKLQERIAELVNEKKIEGIAAIRDESDRDGMRLVIELKRDAVTKVVLNQLFKHTQMQETFGVIMLALVDGRPKVLTLKEMMQHYIDHRHTVVIRRTKFDLAEAEKRAHILEGLKIALDNLDAIITLIRKSKDGEEAKDGLMQTFKLSEIQAKAILDMRLQRLTNLERQKIEEEYREVIKTIEQLSAILNSEKLQMKIIKDELKQIKKEYGDERRTEIVYEVSDDLSIESLIKEEDVIITITHNGYIKRTAVDTYRRQGRGGKGIAGAATKDDDFVEHMFVASTHDYILFFTNFGKCYWQKVYDIPEAARTARGRSLSNLIEFEPNEKVMAHISVKEFSDSLYVVMATKNGLIKKTALSEFSNPRRTGILAINIEEGDELIGAKLTDGNHQIILAKSSGYAVRFHESDVRPMGRNSTGVKGAELEKGETVVSLVTTRRTDITLLTVTDLGYGKRSELEEYRMTKRGAAGVITLKGNEKVGNLVAMVEVADEDDLILMTKNGIVNRQHVSDIRVMGRNTSGVRLIRLEEGDRVSAVARVPKEDEEAEETSSDTNGQA
ncbi:MAG: DNA gyrase subunit A [Chloroherpetonaceae bacterium]|nr:DNA gyrase subunit A [Chloroherpetonaceae bacterium]MDW8020958.1 DNA gyrase subunit A [Chloroherpetonaceae bacterium]